MDLRDKQKIVQVIDVAELAITKLEQNVAAFKVEGKTPPKSDLQLLRSIERSLNLLKINPFAGDSIPFKLWPKEFENLPNLFRMELSQFWRLLYYITGDEVKVISVVFEICDHEDYNKIFRYKGK